MVVQIILHVVIIREFIFFQNFQKTLRFCSVGREIVDIVSDRVRRFVEWSENVSFHKTQTIFSYRKIIIFFSLKHLS